MVRFYKSLLVRKSVLLLSYDIPLAIVIANKLLRAWPEKIPILEVGGIEDLKKIESKQICICVTNRKLVREVESKLGEEAIVLDLDIVEDLDLLLEEKVSDSDLLLVVIDRVIKFGKEEEALALLRKEIHALYSISQEVFNLLKKNLSVRNIRSMLLEVHPKDKVEYVLDLIEKEFKKRIGREQNMF